MKLLVSKTLIYTLLLGAFITQNAFANVTPHDGAPFPVGYSVAVGKVNLQSMKYAKSVGISCIETSLSEFIDKEKRTFLLGDEEIRSRLRIAKAAADEAGVKIWSIHMPFSSQIDLSLADEGERMKVVALHMKVLMFCEILDPTIILFHPSYYLGINEREVRKTQFIKSATALNEQVQKMGSQMVVENMWGKDLVIKGTQKEWPLYRTVEEAVELMSRLPKSIGSAIDLNHILHPENLIMAMGKRLKTLHVSDDDGVKERHYFPCSGEGSNNWNAILGALEKVKYKGPFLFECHIDDVKDLKTCYETLYSNYKNKSKE